MVKIIKRTAYNYNEKTFCLNSFELITILDFSAIKINS